MSVVGQAVQALTCAFLQVFRCRNHYVMSKATHLEFVHFFVTRTMYGHSPALETPPALETAPTFARFFHTTSYT